MSAAEEGRKVFGMEWGLKSGDSVMLLDDGGLDGGGRWLLTCPAGVSSPVARIDERGGGRGWMVVAGVAGGGCLAGGEALVAW